MAMAYTAPQNSVNVVILSLAEHQTIALYVGYYTTLSVAKMYGME
jgi:hypothetical protein